MQRQLTVRLPPDLAEALRRARRRLGRKTSDIVRLALQQFLQVGEPGAARPAERVRDLICSLQSGVPDLAERHREHVLAALKRRGR